MCGIAGIYEPGANNKAVMEEMLKVLDHRGPDAATEFSHGNMTLGHRRLSIIDIEGGDQPMFNNDRTLCIIYNGELYNYKELKKELSSRGYTFRTQCDTEVVLAAYEVLGKECVVRFNGIFAFAIYNLETGDIYLARDHFGIKPIHYHYQDNLFCFASEQKAIIQHPRFRKELNYTALHIHLNLRYTQSQETLLKGIKRIPPAHYLFFSQGEIKELKQYWKHEPVIDRKMTEKEAIEGIHHYMKQAVRRQLISDVPIGVYLSGGLDSSTIVQKMHELGVEEINTFTLGFNEPTDEFPDARLVAKTFDTNHRELSLTMNPLEELEETIWYAEEPKINLLQGYNMSRFVQNHIKVALGGLGGDELLAGYDIHKFIYPIVPVSKKLPSFLKKILNLKSTIFYKIQNATLQLKWDEYRRGVQMLMAAGDIEKYYLILRNVWDYDNDMYSKIYSDDFLMKHRTHLNPVYTEFNKYFGRVKEMNVLDQVLYVEMKTKMVNDYLLVEDRMSMSHSVEERVPFLDLDLVDFCSSIPVQYKIHKNRTKDLFRRAMKDHLPDQIISKKKWGFTVNPYLQFKKDLKEVCEGVLNEKYIKEQGIFNYHYIRRILDAPPHPRMRWHYNFLWTILGLAYWEKRFL